MGLGGGYDFRRWFGVMCEGGPQERKGFPRKGRAYQGVGQEKPWYAWLIVMEGLGGTQKGHTVS